MWSDELLEDAELDVLRAFLETEIRIPGQSQRIRVGLHPYGERGRQVGPHGQAGRKQQVSVQQFHASFTRGLAEGPIQGCQRKSRSKRQVVNKPKRRPIADRHAPSLRPAAWEQSSPRFRVLVHTIVRVAGGPAWRRTG